MIPAPCPCGEVGPHAIAKRRTVDDVEVEFWSDGRVFVFDEHGNAGALAVEAGLRERGGSGGVFRAVVAEGLTPGQLVEAIGWTDVYELRGLRECIARARCAGT